MNSRRWAPCNSWPHAWGDDVDVRRVFDRVSPQCAGVNDMNRLLISLDNRMTPREAHQLARHISQGRLLRAFNSLRRRSSAEVYTRTQEWASQTLASFNLTKHVPASSISTQRRWTRGGATLYQSNAAPSDALMIGFAGNLRRLMLPTPLLLQQVSPFGVDVLKLECPRGTAFRDGVDAYSDDLPSTVEWLRALITEHGASRVVVLGTSSGAFPAILAGLSLGASSVLAVGTRTDEPGSFVTPPEHRPLADVIASCQPPGPPPTVHLLFGSESPLDSEFAAQVGSHLESARLLPVVGAGHACLFRLINSGTMQATLRSTLFAD